MRKIEELKSVIGQEVSENFSPTLRAKLLVIDETRGGGTCIMEVVKSPYKSFTENNYREGERYEAPIYRIWNAYFF